MEKSTEIMEDGDARELHPCMFFMDVHSWRRLSTHSRLVDSVPSTGGFEEAIFKHIRARSKDSFQEASRRRFLSISRRCIGMHVCLYVCNVFMYLCMYVR